MYSAFNALTGFTCITSNTRYIYDRKWIATEVQVFCSKAATVLGISIDLTDKWDELKEVIKQKIKVNMSLIAAKTASKNSELMVYTQSSIMSILYFSKLSPVTLTEHETMAKLMHRELISVMNL